jgi:hypothetical protein
VSEALYTPPNHDSASQWTLIYHLSLCVLPFQLSSIFLPLHRFSVMSFQGHSLFRRMTTIYPISVPFSVHHLPLGYIVELFPMLTSYLRFQSFQPILVVLHVRAIAPLMGQCLCNPIPSLRPRHRRLGLERKCLSP